MSLCSFESIPDTVWTLYARALRDTGQVNLKESIFLTRDMHDTVKYKWRDPQSRWSWQTRFDEFVRPHHLSYTFTHLVDTLTELTTSHSFSQGSMYPVYLPGDVNPVITQSIYFRLTAATPALKQVLFPEFLDSEMGTQYTLSEEPRDPEAP